MPIDPTPADTHAPKPAIIQTPEELRAKDRAKRAQAEIRYDVAEKQMYIRWVVAAVVASGCSALANYLAFRPAILIHVLYTVIAVAALVRLKRGPLTGLIILGLGNEILSAMVGTFSLIGFFSFMSVGGLMGIAVYIHRQP